MLGKQGWRFLSQTNTLAFRIFKAKYFPDGDFLNAMLGSSPSFTWRSIFASQQLLRKGVRWRIEDGANVKVWTDSWLPQPSCFTVQQVPLTDVRDQRLNEFLLPMQAGWDITKLCENFNEADVRLIRSIPTSCFQREDELMWHYDKLGVYSVKSAYHVARSLSKPCVSITFHASWYRLWHLDVPSKVKDFVWRLLVGVLPDRCRLHDRGIPIPVGCPFCSLPEDATHALWGCNRSQQIWSYWEFHSQLGVHDIASFFTMGFLSKSFDMITQFCFIAWGIWRSRNAKIFRSEDEHPMVVFDLSLKELCVWKEAQSTKVNYDGPNNLHMQSTFGVSSVIHSDWFCWVDAALFPNEGRSGYGIVFIDSNGRFLQAISGWLPELHSVCFMEAFALRAAMSWATSTLPLPDCFFSDSQVVVRGVSSKRFDATEYGLLILDCQKFVSIRDNFSLRWVKRQVNLVAHTLARASISYSCCNDWQVVLDT